MRVNPVSTLTSLLLIAACAPTGAVLPKPKASSQVTSAAPSPTAVVDTKGKLSPSRPGLAVEKLQKPTSGAGVLSGKIVLEANNLISRGGGSLAGVGGKFVTVGSHIAGAEVQTPTGGTLITNDGGTLITNDGGTLITNDGATIVAQGGGNVIPPNATGASGAGLAPTSLDGFSLIAQGSSGIIAQGGGNIIAQGGGNAVAAHGSNMVVQGGGAAFGEKSSRYHLTAATLPPVGTQLPAAGMRVSLVDLETHHYLPIGRDSSGQNVYSVYSNVSGAFEIYPPDNAPKNVLVVASVPGNNDGTLVYNLVSPPSGTQRDLTENSDLISRYIRSVLVRRLRTYMKSVQIASDASAPPGTSPGCGAARPADPNLVAFDTLSNHFPQAVAKAAIASGVNKLPLPAQDDLARRMADVLLAGVNLNDAQVDTAAYPFWHGHPPERAADALTQILGEFTAGVASRLAANPAAFDAFIRDTVAANDTYFAYSLTDPCTYPRDILASPGPGGAAYPGLHAFTKPTEAGLFMQRLLADGDAWRGQYIVRFFEASGIDPTQPAFKTNDEILSRIAAPDEPGYSGISRIHHLTAAAAGLVVLLAVQLTDPDRQKLVLGVLPKSPASP